MALGFRTLDRLAGQAEVPPVSGRQWAQILESVVQKRTVPVTPRRHKSWEWVVPVASLAALILIGLFVVSPFFKGHSPSASPGAGTVSEASTADERPIADSDKKTDKRLEELPPENSDGSPDVSPERESQAQAAPSDL
jgi:hypothetical protein